MNKEPFAKIFDSKKHGQIVAIKQKNDEELPEIKVFFYPEGLDVCSIGIGFTDDDDGWEKRDRGFEALTVKEAEVWINYLEL